MTMTRTHRRPALAAALVCLLAGAASRDEVLRLANLAGRVEVVPGPLREVVVDATIHAEGRNAEESKRLLDGMDWVKGHDKKGREEWALSYPVDDYDSFAYPRPGREEISFLGFDLGHTGTTYRGERVRVYSRRRGSTPTLFANLRIAMPRNAYLAVRNVVGHVRGGHLQGNLTIDTGSGDVQLATFAGTLDVDTGSGDVTIASTRGETRVDTGSGDVTVNRWIGNGSVDTGSGDVTVSQVSAGKLSIDTGSGDVTVRGGAVATLLADTGSGSIRVLGVEVEEVEADTGSGDVVIESSLAETRRIVADTGSGSVRVLAGPAASFDLEASQGSGDLIVGYRDAQLRRDGRKVVGAVRGNGRTKIRCDTGSGDCEVSPRG
jgi:hypothetical protein